MRWAVNLYTTESARKKLPSIMRRVRTGRLQPGVCLITLASNEQNLLDIIPAASYLQRGVAALSPDIVGVAKGEEEAQMLAARIVSDVWEKSGSFDVRNYFKFQE